MTPREGVKGPEAKRLVASRVWGSARGLARPKVSGPLDFSCVPLDVLKRIVEAK